MFRDVKDQKSTQELKQDSKKTESQSIALANNFEIKIDSNKQTTATDLSQQFLPCKDVFYQFNLRFESKAHFNHSIL